MRRGELRGYTRPSTPDVAADRGPALQRRHSNDSPRPWLLGIELRVTDPGDILAVPVEGGRVAYAGDLTRLYRAWVGERVGALGPTTLSRLDGALRAALDL